MNERITIKTDLWSCKANKVTPFPWALLKQWVTRKNRCGQQDSGSSVGFMHHSGLCKNCALLTPTVKGVCRVPWMFRSFLVIGLEAREAKRENQGCPLIGAKGHFPLSSSPKHTKCLKRLPSFGSGKRSMLYSATYFTSPTLWWWQVRSWLSLYISARISPFWSCWRMFIFLFEEAQALE